MSKIVGRPTDDKCCEERKSRNTGWEHAQGEGGAGGGDQEKLSEIQYLSKGLKEVKEEAVQTSEGVASQSEGMARAETLR